MKTASKDLVLLAAVGVAVFWFMSRSQTAAAAAAPAKSPAANADRIRLGRAILGVPDILGILKGVNLPTFGQPYPSTIGEDWIAVQTGTDQLDELPLVQLDRAGTFNPSNPFGPSVQVDPTDPYGTKDMFQLFLTNP